MKSFFRTIHLYLALAAGIVISVSCLTGAILVFEKEFQMSFYPERYKVEVGGNKASLGLMINNLQEKVKGAKVRSVK
ncbi:MAG: PepSY domain-containing protein, partial [Sphingobacteriales bacterium]